MTTRPCSVCGGKGMLPVLNSTCWYREYIEGEYVVVGEVPCHGCQKGKR